MSLQAIQRAVNGFTQLPVFRVGIANVPTIVHRWITANPGQSALIITNGILFFTPAALTGPLLATMGFGASGPVAGTVAAWLQSILGNVGAHSVFAYLQSAAMGGYGLAAVNGIVQAGGMISGAALFAYHRLGGRRGNPQYWLHREPHLNTYGPQATASNGSNSYGEAAGVVERPARPKRAPTIARKEKLKQIWAQVLYFEAKGEDEDQESGELDDAKYRCTENLGKTNWGMDCSRKGTRDATREDR